MFVCTGSNATGTLGENERAKERRARRERKKRARGTQRRNSRKPQPQAAPQSSPRSSSSSPTPSAPLPTADCDHVGIFQGNVGRDIGLILILPLFLALASAGGIGGGGIVVPILLMLGDFPPYYSIPLSVTSIVGVSIVCFIIQIRRHHPNPRVEHRPLIAFDVVLLLLPMALAGTVLGVLLNGVSPNWLVLVTIFFVLTYSSFKTVGGRRGWCLWSDGSRSAWPLGNRPLESSKGI